MVRKCFFFLELSTGSPGKPGKAVPISVAASLSFYELPAFEVLDRRATGTTVPPGAGNAGFKHTARPDRLCRNAHKRYLQPSAPAGVGLARICPDIHVHEALSWRSLYKRSAQG